MSTNETNNLLETLKPFYDDQMEKRIALQNTLFEKKNMWKIARLRESCVWELLGGLSVAAILSFSSQLTRNRFFVVPIIPIVVWTGYRFDTAYGNNIVKIQGDVKEMLNSIEGKQQIRFPGPPITLAELDKRRKAWKNQ